MNLTLRILESGRAHVKLALYVNGGLVSGPCGITVRRAELVEFVLRVDPEEIEVDRENISSYVWERLRGFKALRLV